jgi:hypothetical protein
MANASATVARAKVSSFIAQARSTSDSQSSKAQNAQLEGKKGKNVKGRMGRELEFSIRLAYVVSKHHA